VLGYQCVCANPTSPQSALSWALETDLDLQVIHALAPNAHILLVSAAGTGLDLYTSVQYAYSHGADIVSNSWGSEEFNGETGLDTSFFGLSPVPILFSSGDTGGALQFPCASPNVVCVCDPRTRNGGVSLYIALGHIARIRS
jgi:subtilase family serine protease